MSKTVILKKPYTPHPDDTFLWMTLCVYNGQYVTFMYNAHQEGFEHGNYFKLSRSGLLEAVLDFIRRGDNIPLGDVQFMSGEGALPNEPPGMIVQVADTIEEHYPRSEA